MELKAHLIFCLRATYEIDLRMKLNCDNFKVTYRHFWFLPSQGVLNERKTWEFNVILFAATSSKSVQNCHLIRPWPTRNITFFLWHKSFIGVIICIAIHTLVSQTWPGKRWLPLHVAHTPTICIHSGAIWESPVGLELIVLHSSTKDQGNFVITCQIPFWRKQWICITADTVKVSILFCKQCLLKCCFFQSKIRLYYIIRVFAKQNENKPKVNMVSYYSIFRLVSKLETHYILKTERES